MTETKLPGMVINRIDKKSTYDSLVENGEIGENDLCLIEDEDNISPGGSGTDISLGVTGATVGDIIKVKAVDDSGKPTAWETVDMVGGGGGYKPLELLYETTLTEDVTTFQHEFDACDEVELHILNYSATSIPGDTFHRCIPNKKTDGNFANTYPIKLAKGVSSGGAEEAVYRFERHDGYINLFNWVSMRNAGNGGSPREVMFQTMWDNSKYGGANSFAYTDKIDAINFTGLTLASGVVIRIYGKKQG